MLCIYFLFMENCEKFYISAHTCKRDREKKRGRERWCGRGREGTEAAGEVETLGGAGERGGKRGRQPEDAGWQGRHAPGSTYKCPRASAAGCGRSAPCPPAPEDTAVPGRGRSGAGGGRARGRQGVGDAAHRRRLTAVALHSHRGRSHWAAPAWPGSAHGPAPCEGPRYRGRLGLWASSGFSRQAAVGELSLRLAPSVGEQASALQKLVAGRPCPVGFRRLLSASRAALPGSLASTPGATPRVAPRRAPAPRAPWRFPAAALLRSPVRLAWNLHFLPSA